VVDADPTERWADEASVGYNVDDLRRRRRGHPGCGAGPAQGANVRLTAVFVEAQDVLADQRLLTKMKQAQADRTPGSV
jgi:hypothetical protein